MIAELISRSVNSTRLNCRPSHIDAPTVKYKKPCTSEMINKSYYQKTFHKINQQTKQRNEILPISPVGAPTVTSFRIPF